MLRIRRYGILRRRAMQQACSKRNFTIRARSVQEAGRDRIGMLLTFEPDCERRH
jgi:hypothetical protein